ncbi:MAG: ATP-binding cassette domain-containing protein [Firmicutes bacterium]|nr:ATP-binding cassette domain-containing protein [Candidatus Colimorpha enterica]
MEENKEVLLSVQHLEQYFKSGKFLNKAVDDVNFDIYKGEVFGLVGESGCGKTTTGRSIIRLYDITGGSVYFKGQRICAGTRRYKEEIENVKKEYSKKIADDPANAATLKSECDAKVAELKNEIKLARHDHKHVDRDIMNKMQMIFQDPIASLDPRMTVREIISEGLTIRGIKDKAYIDEQVFKTLDLVGLVPEHAGRYPHEFSGGQRQRIGIARAIVLNPELIIADEPISALDVSIQAQVINLLNELRSRLGLTIMFIAHDLSVVKYFSDRIAVMYYGKIVELTTSDELFAHPLHPYTKSLLSAIPLPDPHSEKTRKRITYNPIQEHDYSVEQPTMREVSPGHFVRCNTAEFEKYQEILANG